MRKKIISLLALLLLAAQAQAQKEPLAVLVVGVDSWMFGDVIAHIVGEELKRGNPNLVPVTREKFVQNKLKALRRASGAADITGQVSVWAKAQGLAQVCLVRAAAGHSFTSATQIYSAQLINVAGCQASCSDEFTFEHSGAPGEMSAAELTKVAWEVVGRLRSNSCKPSYVKCYSWEPEVALVKHGTFTMGCDGARDWIVNDNYSYCGSYEEPKHPVTLTKDFRIGVTEVTQGEWKAVMGSLPSELLDDHDKLGALELLGDDKPIVDVSYDDITGPNGYLERLNAAAGITDPAQQYRLPTEAEWEYAARGGHHMESFRYSGSDDVGEVAWCNNLRLKPVKGKKANALGVYDMSGNVYEICADNWADYPSAAQVDPKVTSGRTYVFRGGAYVDYESNSRVAYRDYIFATNKAYFVGFRVVLP
jgi:formylglycine-generating enzyme required for sulfatase activity